MRAFTRRLAYFFTSKLTDVGDAGENGLEAVEQLKAIIAELLVPVHDHDLVEETVDGRAQGGEGSKCGRTILGSKGGIDSGLSSLEASASGKLDLAHQSAVVLHAQLGLGDMRGASIGGRKVVERLGVVLAGPSRAAAQRAKKTDDGAMMCTAETAATVSAGIFSSRAMLQAAMEEVANLLGDWRRRLNALLAIELEGEVDERRGVDRQTVAQDVDDADSGTTQRVGVREEPVGGLANGKDTGDGIELVGAGHDAASGALAAASPAKRGR